MFFTILLVFSKLCVIIIVPLCKCFVVEVFCVSAEMGVGDVVAVVML